MKIWNSYGSEHSANLIMVGRFKDVASAEKAKTTIDEITRFISAREGDLSDSPDRYPTDVMELFRRLNTYMITPTELEQFRYDVSIGISDKEISLSTDEYDVSAFLKLLVHNGAKVEVYSKHDYPEQPNSKTRRKSGQ